MTIINHEPSGFRLRMTRRSQYPGWYAHGPGWDALLWPNFGGWTARIDLNGGKDKGGTTHLLYPRSYREGREVIADYVIKFC